jgi:hypothetical protein
VVRGEAGNRTRESASAQEDQGRSPERVTMEKTKRASALFFMLNPEQCCTVEPPGDALLRLAELNATLNASAELLTPADACAIWHELNTVARALKHISYPKQPHRRTINAAITTAPTQGDLLG